MIAESNSKIVAAASLEREPLRASHVGEFWIAISNPEFRGRGRGAIMIKELLAQAKGKFKLIELTVFSTNKAQLKVFTNMVISKSTQLCQSKLSTKVVTLTKFI